MNPVVNPKWRLARPGENLMMQEMQSYARILAVNAVGSDSYLYHDLLSDVQLVLIKAVREYDPERGPSLQKHVMYRMRREVTTFFARKWVQDSNKTKSLYAPFGVNNNYGKSLTYLDTIPAKANGGGAITALVKLERSLTVREYVIAKMRIDNYTVEEIARVVGMTKAGAEQAIARLTTKIDNLIG